MAQSRVTKSIIQRKYCFQYCPRDLTADRVRPVYSVQYNHCFHQRLTSGPAEFALSTCTRNYIEEQPYVSKRAHRTRNNPPNGIQHIRISLVIVNDSLTLFRIQHCRSSTQHISYFVFCSISPVWPRVVEINKLRLPFN
jgi:hypothetical protein